MFGEWAETVCWETKARTTPQMTCRLVMGPETGHEA